MKNRAKYNTKSCLKWISSHVIKYPIILMSFIISVIGLMYLSNVTSIYLGNIFNALELSERQDVMDWISLFIIASLASGGFQIISSYSILGLRLKVEKDIRSELYSNLIHKSQSFHDSVQKGNIMALSTNEIRNISIMFQPGLLLSLRSMLSYLLPVYFILVRYDWVLLITPGIFIITSIIFIAKYSKNINKITKKLRKSFSKLNSDLNETTDGIEVLKASSQKGMEKEKFQDNTDAVYNFSIKRAIYEATYIPTLIFGIFFGVALLQSLMMYVNGMLSLGQVITYIALFSNMKFPIANAEVSFSLIGLGIASAKRIISTLNASPVKNQIKGKVEQRIKGRIEFKNVSFAYDNGNYVLKKINVNIEQGSTVALVGSTGSGKSTFIKLINKMYTCNEGKVLIDGINVNEWNENNLCSQIGIIEQDIFLYSWKIKDNISFGSQAETTPSSEIIREAAEKACAHDFIVDLKDEYETIVGERGVTLSGGQRQRVAIARAFVSNPSILIIDDATSSVDSDTEFRIQRSLDNLVASRTAVIITHRLSQIRKADKIIVLDNGEILAMGSHDDLMANCKKYSLLYAEYY